MSLAQSVALRDLNRSAFPLEPRHQAPRAVWHSKYPQGVPRGLVYPNLRAEGLLLCAAEHYPDREALSYYHTSWTYEELCNRVRQVAANFNRLGIRTGDRVLMVLPTCPEFVVAWFALHWLGAEIVQANPLLAPSDLVRLAEQSQARAVIGLDIRLGPVIELLERHPIRLLLIASLAGHLPWRLRWPYQVKHWLDRFTQGRANTQIYMFDALYQSGASPIAKPLLSDPELPAVLQPTGGTTGTPKIAVLRHRNLVANVAQLHVWSGLEPGAEVMLAVLPFFHVFGSTVGMLSALAGGATLLLQARFDPGVVCKLMRERRPTVAPMVPFVFAALCEEMRRQNQNISGLRICHSGAAPLDPSLAAEFQQRTGALIFEGYGLSEASPVTHCNPPDNSARLGIGLPLPDTEAKVVDAHDSSRDLPPGEVGELVVRGPQVMAGYLNDPDETEQTLRNGWLYTGDLARMDDDGFFTLVERKKDMIISGGLNIYPSEVEQVMASHLSVSECAVVGVADELFGERVVGYVVPAPGAQLNQAELEAHCRKELASYKIPRTINVCSELPTNFLGKVRRSELRRQAAEDGRQPAA